MALYLGSKKVCPTKIITKEVPSMKTFFNAGGKCAYSIATGFKGIIQYSDTSKVTNMIRMFASCSNLTTIPRLNTSKVTNMHSMFDSCSSLTTIPLLDTSNVTNMNSMFDDCALLTAIPLLDTSNVTDMSYMFSYCLSLTTIPQLDASKVTNLYNAFYSCRNLEAIHMINMKVDFNISPSTKFTREALVEIINNCYNITTLNKTAKLIMGSTNLAKLTDEDKLIATNKGWTLA